ncbi:MAG TPA: hypothetical protein DEO32_02145 [Ruminococcaceae bacterium]|nr:hypothetical protein [Oscillospiraceae bacterium]
MTQINSAVDSIIILIKNIEPFDGVRFVREYNTSQIETPVSSPLAAVRITSVNLCKSYVGGYVSPARKGDYYCVEVSICFYAPSHENGSGLSELACAAVNALNSLEDGDISEISASAIAFDADAEAVYRTVSFKLRLFIDGRAVV